MTLLTRINLVLSLVFLVALGAAGYVSHSILQSNANREVITHAGIMMAAAKAVRSYTVNEVKPLLTDKLAKTFLPQTVPSYAATQNFNRLRESHPEYIYKEATLNPTNPRDRATDWESDIIQQFRNNEELQEVVGERMTPTGPSLYLARPIRITNGECLACHSVPASAPKSMLKLYGDSNGFGWQMDEVVGSQIVSVPSTVPLEQANHAFRVFMAALVAVFVAIFLVVNLILRWLVIKPAKQIASLADQVSTGDFSVAEFKTSGKDEISQLGVSFNRMRRSLEKTMSMLDDQA